MKGLKQNNQKRERRIASATRTLLGMDRGGSAAAKPVHPKWAWYYRVLLGLRERLLRARDEHLAQSAVPLEPHSMDVADSATDEFDHDMALSELSSEQDALFEIEEALKRILNGTYGVCMETGKPIPERRLKAIPWTRFAREVEARLERKGLVSRPHLGTLGSVRGEARRDLEDIEPEEKKHPPPDESLREVTTPPKIPGRPREAAARKKIVAKARR